MAEDPRTFLGDVDMQLLGQRVREARVARRWSQTELAGSDFSVAHISRIEAGQRRPSRQVLDRLASRLGVSAEDLLASLAETRLDEARLALDYAELSLESAEAVEAERQASGVLDRLPSNAPPEVRSRASYLRARALEALGRPGEAIELLEALVENGDPGSEWVGWCIALSRCYRESGDFGRAVDVGERAVQVMRDAGLRNSDEVVQITVTLAAAYFERGDVGHAVRMCRRAIAEADLSGSSKARASAYWNASMIEAKEGSVSKAIPLARKALALLGEGQDQRNLARLHSQLGLMLLNADPPELAEATEALNQAQSAFAATSSSPTDVLRNELGRARAMFLAADHTASAALSAEVVERTIESAPLIAADARALEGQIRAALGDIDGARADYRAAATILTAVGADRTAAQLWFEFATLMDALGDADGARDAYRRAAASTGLRSTLASDTAVRER